jgi:diphosphomevalonate decarboxylase
MHATMRDSNPPVNYSLSETNSIKQAIWQLRKQGLEIFFTQDAGPNLKLLFLNKDTEIVTQQFRNIEIVRPFINNQ